MVKAPAGIGAKPGDVVTAKTVTVAKAELTFPVALLTRTQ
jgi:hypothetical protein